MKIEETTKEEMIKEWCNQWTIEYLNKNVFKKVNKLMKNPLFIYTLEKWYLTKVSNERKRVSYIEEMLKDATNCIPYIDRNQDKYNDMIYEFFTKVDL